MALQMTPPQPQRYVDVLDRGFAKPTVMGRRK